MREIWYNKRNGKKVRHTAYSEAQKRATAKYNVKAYDRIELKVPKGSKAKIKARANSRNMSLNSYVCGLIEVDMKEENP